MNRPRIVITGVGLTSPNGNSISEFRDNLLHGVANIQEIDMKQYSIMKSYQLSYFVKLKDNHK